MKKHILPPQLTKRELPTNVSPFPVVSTTPPTGSRRELEALVARAVRCRLEADAIRVEVDREVAAVRARHQPSLERAESAAQESHEAVRTWADGHRGESFGGRKTMKCLHATIGYRSKPPRVERIRAHAKWGAIAVAMQSQPWASNYVRMPEPEPELNKEALLANRRKLPPGALAHAGLRVVEGEEQFFLKLNATPTKGASPVADELAAKAEEVLPFKAVG